MLRKFRTLSDVTLEFLWERTDRSGNCWLWQAAKTARGYGVVTVDKRHQYAHRLVFALVNGPIPKSMLVCHDCPGGDNPSCIRPDHLFAGTQSDNIRDMVSKGRHNSQISPETLPRGEHNSSAVLDPQKVAQIRALRTVDHLSWGQLAHIFKVSPTAVRRAAIGETWKHITGAEVAK